MKTLLIVGDSEFIGRRITDYALEKGYKVSWLSTKAISYKDVNVYNWDVSKKKIDTKALEGVDAVINLSGVSIYNKWTPTYKQEILSSRVESTNFLVEQIKLHNPNIYHFIQVSDIGIYPYSKEECFSEISLDFGFHFFAEVCKEWEYSVKRIMDTTHLTILRLGVVLDKNEGMFPLLLKRKYILGDGIQWISWIHIKDLVRLFIYVMEEEVFGVYNAVSTIPVLQKEIVSVIHNIKGKKKLPLRVPSFMVKCIQGKDKAQMLLCGQNISNIKILEKGFDFEYEYIDDALVNILGNG